METIMLIIISVALVALVMWLIISGHNITKEDQEELKRWSAFHRRLSQESIILNRYILTNNYERYVQELKTLGHWEA